MAEGYVWPALAGGCRLSLPTRLHSVRPGNYFAARYCTQCSTAAAAKGARGACNACLMPALRGPGGSKWKRALPADGSRLWGSYSESSDRKVP